jgi:hypothetical protein
LSPPLLKKAAFLRGGFIFCLLIPLLAHPLHALQPHVVEKSRAVALNGASWKEH